MPFAGARTYAEDSLLGVTAHWERSGFCGEDTVRGNHWAPRKEHSLGESFRAWELTFPHVWQGSIRAGVQWAHLAAPLRDSKSNLAIGELLPTFLSWLPFNALLLGPDPPPPASEAPCPALVSPLCCPTVEGLTPKMLSDSSRPQQDSNRDLSPTHRPIPEKLMPLSLSLSLSLQTLLILKLKCPGGKQFF